VREKREHLRADYRVNVNVQGEWQAQVDSRDVSLGGMFVFLPEGATVPRIGMAVSATFPLPVIGTVTVPAYVRWSSDGGVGLQFGLIGPRETNAIGKLVRASRP
jgi:PilZ domain